MKYIDWLRKDYTPAIKQWRWHWKELTEDEFNEGTNLSMSYGGKKQWDRNCDIYEQVILKQIEAANFDRKTCILDAGCGYGFLLYQLYQRKLRRLYGIDVSEICVDICQKRFDERDIQAEIKLGNLVKTGYDCDQFGLVICTEVLEHCQRPLKVVNELYRIMKPGGVCYLSMPYLDRRQAWTHINLFYKDQLPNDINKILNLEDYQVIDVESMMFESYFVEFEISLTVGEKFVIVKGVK